MSVTPDRLLEFIGNHWIMVSGVVVVAALLIQDILESALRKHKAISPSEAVTLMNEDDTVIVDVREPSEYAEGHIEGARNIPVGKIADRINELEPYKQNPIIVACNSGTRSPTASKQLVRQGFSRICELKGGMVAWEEQKLPISKKRTR
jgi:rhodanese-related sulfurtransferase